mmetsp:Transcript_43457/g.72264  ORF Transcript_43457/g.72264 Transcript_43457/m.72264 type:complete len:106 (+) Transcript_43457:260-577(+)
MLSVWRPTSRTYNFPKRAQRLSCDAMRLDLLLPLLPLSMRFHNDKGNRNRRGQSPIQDSSQKTLAIATSAAILEIVCFQFLFLSRGEAETMQRHHAALNAVGDVI